MGPLPAPRAAGHPGVAQERLIHLRAERVVVATGAYEAPLLFQNNDVPGVMLSSGVQRLLHQHGVRAGECAVVVSAAPGGERSGGLKPAGRAGAPWRKTSARPGSASPASSRPPRCARYGAGRA